MIQLRALDLFAGIGGFRLALNNTRLQGVQFSTVAACEIDLHCKSVYEASFKIDSTQEQFINDVKNIKRGGKLNPIEGIQLPDFDILLGGFPCQPFSNIGNRNGLQDPRGLLIYDIIELLRYYQPKFFVLENVSKIITIGKGEVFRTILEELDKVGYHVHTFDLYADQYGLPQKRRRMFFCGISKQHSRKKGNLDIPEPTPRENWKYPTAWHLLERHMDEAHLIPTKSRLTVLKPNPKWMGNLEINLPIARPLTASMSKWHRANQDNYYSEDYVINNSDPYISIPVNLQSDRIRRITPLEGFRLQGFPDYYADTCKLLKLSNTATYRMIGNAVPVDMAAAVIDNMLSYYL